jgi:hypothetical protein
LLLAAYGLLYRRSDAAADGNAVGDESGAQENENAVVTGVSLAASPLPLPVCLVEHNLLVLVCIYLLERDMLILARVFL